MRAKYRRHILNLALVLAPALAACGTQDTGNTGGTLPAGLTLPDCVDGQLLGSSEVIVPDPVTGVATKKLQLACVNAPVAKLDLPAACGDSGALNSDGTALNCVTKASGNLDSMFTQQIDQYTQQITDLTNTVTVIQNGGGARAKFAGTTTTTYKGAITDAAGNIGLVAAANNCAAQFGVGAKMCTIYDIVSSVADGTINPQKAITTSWVYAANWKSPLGTPNSEPLAGLSDNCAGYTYPTGDKKWSGTAFIWAQVTFTGRFAPKFASDSKCSDLKPIACCK